MIAVHRSLDEERALEKAGELMLAGWRPEIRREAGGLLHVVALETASGTSTDKRQLVWVDRSSIRGNEKEDGR